MAKGSRGGKGGAGRYGGTGGLKPGDVRSTTNIMSEREHNQAMVDEALETFKDVFNEYGTIVQEIQVAELSPKQQSVLAFYDIGDNIAINKTYLNKKAVEEAYSESVKSGLHPSNGNKTALQAVVAHELGHKLTADVGTKIGKGGFQNLDSVAKTIVDEARKSTKHRGVIQMARKISEYATASNAEAIAEAFSDVFCNGKKAKSESRAIVDVINKYLK